MVQNLVRRMWKDLKDNFDVDRLIMFDHSGIAGDFIFNNGRGYSFDCYGESCGDYVFPIMKKGDLEYARLLTPDLASGDFVLYLQSVGGEGKETPSRIITNDKDFINGHIHIEWDEIDPLKLEKIILSLLKEVKE